MTRSRLVLVCLLAGVAAALPAAPSIASASTRYVVVLRAKSADPASAERAVAAAGGRVVANMARQIGVVVAESTLPSFASGIAADGSVETVGRDVAWKAFPSAEEALADGSLTIVAEAPGGGPEPHGDPLEPLQWSMRQIRAPNAHAIEAGSRAVDVGILDTGIDVTHEDFVADQAGPNLDIARGRDFTVVGTQHPYVDNNFHGTHVAGIVAAQANGVGVVGVAPNVTLVSVKVCDASGYCYFSSAVQGITYAGDAKLDVANMSFFVDDDQLLQSTEFKCMDDPTQRTFRRAVERAIDYARMRGVTPVAALGNSDEDLAHPEAGNECDVVPAETQGVTGVASLGPESEKAYYSNYGTGQTDVAAPGGNSRGRGEIPGPCGTQVLSTVPTALGKYGCFQGTSMASPHAAGVAALIVSRFGELGPDGDVEMRPTSVEAYLQDTTVDIGLRGYDECFGNGRIDAYRAVLHDTSVEREANPPCPEYAE